MKKDNKWGGALSPTGKPLGLTTVSLGTKQSLESKKKSGGRTKYFERNQIVGFTSATQKEELKRGQLEKRFVLRTRAVPRLKEKQAVWALEEKTKHLPRGKRLH